MFESEETYGETTMQGFGSVHMWERLTPQQQSEALGEENKYFTWLEIGHSPSWHEAVTHYFCNMRPTVFELYVEEPRKEAA